MDSKKRHVANMLLVKESTTKMDFHYIQPEDKPTPEPAAAAAAGMLGAMKHQQTDYELPKCIESMTVWNKPVPFSLFIKKNEILHCDPHTMQGPSECSKDMEREEVQRTRPRLALLPAGIIDDLEPKLRDVLINDIYVGTIERDLRQVAREYFNDNVKAPLPGTYSCVRPLKMPKVDVPYISPEWRMETVTWDSKQTRGQCHPTEYFWLNRQPDRSWK